MTEPLTFSASTMRFVICPHAVDLRFLRCLLCQDRDAVFAERARIRAAVEDPKLITIYVVPMVPLAAVLAAIEGDEHD